MSSHQSSPFSLPFIQTIFSQAVRPSFPPRHLYQSGMRRQALVSNTHSTASLGSAAQPDHRSAFGGRSQDRCVRFYESHLLLYPRAGINALAPGPPQAPSASGELPGLKRQQLTTPEPPTPLPPAHREAEPGSQQRGFPLGRLEKASPPFPHSCPHGAAQGPPPHPTARHPTPGATPAPPWATGRCQGKRGAAGGGLHGCPGTEPRHRAPGTTAAAGP